MSDMVLLVIGTMEITTKKGTFEDLETFLTAFEMPEVFQNLWLQFQKAVPNIRSEAEVSFYPEMENMSTKGYIYTWSCRDGLYNLKKLEHYGFTETVEELSKVAECKSFSVQTNRYRAVFIFNEEKKRIVGFLYLVQPRTNNQ